MADGKVVLSTALDNSGLAKDQNEMIKSAKSQAAKLAAVYRKQGMSQGEAMKKAWSEIERDSKESSQKVGDSIKDGFGGALGSVAGRLGGLTSVLAKASTAIVGAFAAAMVAVTKMSVEAYSDYEQLTGGIATMFKASASKVAAYAEDAFYTAGVSANQYMESVTSFSASLISSLGGDTEKAADIANMAMIDMADNANKMGTEIGLIRSAYQGFAKQNYTMLDNLKLGFGGTKTEMERLLRTAESITGIKYNINNLADVYSAIHVIQENLGIAGATAQEAEKTIAGSAAMTAAAWKNVLAAIAGGGDLDKAINNLVFAISKYFENIVPVVQRSISGIGHLIEAIAPSLVQTVASSLIQAIPSLLNAVYQMIIGLARGIYQGIIALFSGKGVGGISAQLSGISGGFGAAASGADDLADATEGAGKAAKKSLSGFDELNKLQDPNSGGGGGGGGGAIDSGGAEGGGVMEVISDAIGTVEEEFENIYDVIKRIAGYVPVIAAGFGGLKLGSFIADLLTANVEAKTLKETISLMFKKGGLIGGFTLAITGITLETKGIISSIKEGLNGINFTEILSGGGLFVAGAALIGKFFGGTAIGAAIAAIVAGIPMFIAGIYDAIKNGLNWLNGMLIPIGSTLAATGIGTIIGICVGSIGGPMGAAIGAAIGLAVGLITDLVILIVQNWDSIVAWCSEAFTNIGQWFSDVWDGIVDIWNVCAAWFKKYVIDPVVNNFNALYKGLHGIVSKCWKAIVDYFSPAVKWFSELFGSIAQTVSDVFYNIGVLASGCWEIIRLVWSVVTDWFKTKIVQPLADLFSYMWNHFLQRAEFVWDAVKAVFSLVTDWFKAKIVQPIAELFTNMWDNFLQRAQLAWEGVQFIFSKVASFFGKIFEDAWARVVTVFSIGGEIFVNIKDAIVSAFKFVVNGLIRGMNAVIAVPFNGLNARLAFLREISIAGLTPFSGLKEINVPEIPYLAKGAVLPANKPFLAMVGDQRHGTNVEAPLATIQEAVAMVMQDQTAAIMAGFNASVEVQREILSAVLGIQIGDDVIAAAYDRYHAKLAIQRGG